MDEELYYDLGDFRGEAQFMDICPSCGSDEDIEYSRETERWVCHYCEETWLGPPPPPEEPIDQYDQ